MIVTKTGNGSDVKELKVHTYPSDNCLMSLKPLNLIPKKLFTRTVLLPE